MTTRHLRQKIRQLKRRDRYGEVEYKAAMKRHEARLGKRDLELDIEIYETIVSVDQELLEAGRTQESRQRNTSDFKPSWQAMARLESYKDLLVDDIPERCAEDQDIIENYQRLHHGYLRPDYINGWGRTIEEMAHNRGYNSWYAVRRRGLSKAERDKEDQEDFNEVQKELREAGIFPVPNPMFRRTRRNHMPPETKIHVPPTNPHRLLKVIHRCLPTKNLPCLIMFMSPHLMM